MPEFHIRCHRGIESFVQTELRSYGATILHERPGQIQFEAEEAALYRIAMHLRTGQRLWMPLHRFTWRREDDLYHEAQAVDWALHLKTNGTLRCDAQLYEAPLNNPRFASQRLKDAIVDQFKEEQGRRPDVDVVSPDIRVVLHAYRQEATLYLDLGGSDLRRLNAWEGRLRKEQSWQVAAAIVQSAGWEDIVETGGVGIMALQGAWPLAAEAVFQGLALAPGLLRADVGISRWLGLRRALWQEVVQEAQTRQAEAREAWTRPLTAWIGDRQAHLILRDMLDQLGLRSQLTLFRGDALAWMEHHRNAPPSAANGWFCSDLPLFPPLALPQAVYLYAALGHHLRHHLPSWQASLLTPQADLGHRLKLRAHKRRALPWQSDEEQPHDTMLLEILIPAHSEQQQSTSDQDAPPPTPEETQEPATAQIRNIQNA